MVCSPVGTAECRERPQIGDSPMFSRPYGTRHSPYTAPLPALKRWAIFGRPYGTLGLSQRHWGSSPCSGDCRLRRRSHKPTSAPLALRQRGTMIQKRHRMLAEPPAALAGISWQGADGRPQQSRRRPMNWATASQPSLCPGGRTIPSPFLRPWRLSAALGPRDPRAGSSRPRRERRPHTGAQSPPARRHCSRQSEPCSRRSSSRPE